ncbi:ornithine transcarbamylase, mitochondrial-like [Hetaerina americana]|uniref:ornithine transcarbamylase, mitochondrial-like n=1 Tax=Hetaerina americana TaxID=62018 RepID=UPI003A7F3538
MNRFSLNLLRNLRTYWQVNAKRRTSVTINQNIKGRDFLDVNDFTLDELKLIMWTALDLKARFKNTFIRDMHDSDGTMISSLLCEPSVKNQINIEKASQLMGARTCTIIDQHWESAECLSETGRLLSIMSQVILASSRCGKSLCELSAGATVPVINMGSSNSNPLAAIAHAITILTRLNRLERVRIAWVGPSNSSVLSSLLMMMPKFRTHLHMSTENCNTPVNLEKALKLASSYRCEIHHSSSPERATYRADAIITTSHSFDELRITRKLVDEAALKWIFLHDLPRTRNEVTDDVFYHKTNSLVWESAENHAWALMAVMMQVLTEYRPSIATPTFTEEQPT